MRFMLYSVNAVDYGKMEMRASGSLSSHAAMRDSKSDPKPALDPMKCSLTCLGARQQSCVSR